MIKDSAFMTGLRVQEGIAAPQCRRPLRRVLVILSGHGHFDASHPKLTALKATREKDTLKNSTILQFLRVSRSCVHGERPAGCAS